jgi:hypothetical protein
MTGVVVPVATEIGKVPLTVVTVPPPPPPAGALVHAVPFQVYVKLLLVLGSGVDVGEKVFTGVCPAGLAGKRMAAICCM